MISIRKILFSPITMAILLVILAIALGTATFIENDYGSEVAKQKVYNTRWLEFILLILTINLIGRIYQLKLYKAQKFSIFLFHIALVVMILGAAITRYFGYEGSMHIRENQASSTLITYDKALMVNVNQEQTYQFNSKLDQTQTFSATVEHDNQNLEIELLHYYPSAYKKAVEDENGSPVIGFVLAGSNFRGFEYLTPGEARQYGRVSLGFNSSDNNQVQLIYENDSLYMISSEPVFVNTMGGETGSLTMNQKIPFEYKKLYKIGDYSLVLQEFFPKASLKAVPTEVAGHKQGVTAMVFNVNNEANSTEIILWGNSTAQEMTWGKLGTQNIGLAFGNKTIALPFSIHLDDFVIERYPGSMSPSSFSSYVRILEEGYEPVPFHIYMNNILKHHGFRFYQSSYDQDERGTILSVNNDRWGTLITYIGYFLLTLGMIWSMINPHSFFRKTVVRSPKTAVIAVLLMLGSVQSGWSQHHNHSMEKLPPIDQKHAEKFGSLLIQNNKGRTEPVFTYASELMRKISRKEKMLNLTPVQLFMEMNMHPEIWVNEPIIQVSNKELQHMLGVHKKYMTYNDFISNESGYKLQNMVQVAFAKAPTERTKLDKAIIKTDEKVNICYAIYSGRYMKIFPIPGNPNENHEWFPAHEAGLKMQNSDDSLFVTHILPAYFEEVDKARTSGDYTKANEFLTGLINFQQKNAGYELPSANKVKVEIWYYKYNPFKKLFPVYATAGMLFLIMLLVFIVIGKQLPAWLNKGYTALMALAFLFHTFGLAGRWYISGHAPMSNGYESMIFISWVTILAGFLFAKRTAFVLPATAALGGLTLMVANLSFMDPEITNLVPVLQSYWLTIHVSVITASYGFLGLGALIGIINLLLIILRSKNNHHRVMETLESLTIINHKTLIAGLYLLTIGTFLGAVWANESWGRYWGWDPKETWALISIIVYTIVTHARLIPGLKGLFIFNTLALFAFSSILMTYFGVNYYLSGLHSYAGGDPVPVPVFVYYAVAGIILLTLAASIRFRSLVMNHPSENIE
jgi:cytochrome c-type biogenesis protein CcsB